MRIKISEGDECVMKIWGAGKSFSGFAHKMIGRNQLMFGEIDAPRFLFFFHSHCTLYTIEMLEFTILFAACFLCLGNNSKSEEF